MALPAKFYHVTQIIYCRCGHAIKVGNASISIREVIITSILLGFYLKKQFFDGCSWFKFNNLGLPLGMTLKFYASVTKVLKLKVRKFWGLILTFVEVTGEKLVGMLFVPPSSIGLNIIKYQLVEKLEKSGKTKNCSLITFCQ